MHRDAPATDEWPAASDWQHRVAGAGLVFFGERHHEPHILAGQLAVLTAMADAAAEQGRPPPVVVAEQWHTGQARLLQAYSEGDFCGALGEPDVKRLQAAYDEDPEQCLHFSMAHYHHVLEAARQLNCPAVVPGFPGRGEARAIASSEDATTQAGSEAHYRVFASHFGGSPDDVPEGDERYRRIFNAQCFKDNTMASIVAALVQEDPDRSCLVLAGTGHIDYGHGVPKAVAMAMDTRQQLTITSKHVGEQVAVEFAGDAVADLVFHYSPKPCPD